MSITANAQAILLLTTHLGNNSDEIARPLSTKEWGRFALWLKDKSLTPEDLLAGNLAEKLTGWSDTKMPFARIESLLNRGSALALCLEKWTRAGLWVMTRSDPDYPKRLKSRLKNDSPAILFGCGNRLLLNKGGLAVIGSRKAISADLAYTAELGKLASLNGNSIVSGGARGVDETAMLAALEVEGTVIGVLVDSLLKAISSTRYRKHLMNNNLVLVSPFNPEAGFNAGHAMQRNKYIYCLADVAVAVHSGKDGGTWQGAIENLKHEWVPLWVKSTSDTESGNAGLVAKGGRWLSGSIAEVDIDAVMRSKVQKAEEIDLLSIPDSLNPQEERREMLPRVNQSEAVLESRNESALLYNEMAETDSVAAASVSGGVSRAINEPAFFSAVSIDISFYDLFLAKVQPLIINSAKNVDELANALGVNKAQLVIWLSQAVEENKIKKNKKPVAYEWAKQQSLSLMNGN